MGNATQKASGRSYASKASQMRAFDRLPRSIRDALNNAAFSWAPYPLWRWFENGRKPASYWVRKIQEWDAVQIAKDRSRVWGIHDEAPPVQRKRRRT